MLHIACYVALRYIAIAVIVFLLFYGFYFKSRLWKTENYWGEMCKDFSKRLSLLIKYGLLQWKVLKRRYGGTMHTGIYLGLIWIIFAPLILAISIYGSKSEGAALWIGNFSYAFEFLFDILGLFLLSGIILALFRRLYLKPVSLESKKGDFFILYFLLCFVVSGFLLEGLRIATAQPSLAEFSIFGFIISRALIGSQFTLGSAILAYRVVWWVHVLLALGFVGMIPFTRLHHIFTSLINIFFSSLRPKGELTTPFDLKALLESESFDVKVGTDRIDDFGWKQRLSLDACVNCGRCQDICPAYAAGRPLSPKEIIQKLKNQMIVEYHAKGKEAPHNLFEGIIGEEEVWSCTTCWACPEACPIVINQVDFIVDFRRILAAEGKLDSKKTEVITSFTEKSNPYGMPAIDRANWAKGLEVKTLQEDPKVEYLYWVGCASSYDTRNQNIAKAIFKILNKAQVSFGILGAEEKCCGETLRRMGDEGRYQQLVLENIETLQKYNVKKIIVHCPHGYNTLKNEYPKFGGNFKVIHHTEFILSLMKQGKFNINKKLKEKTVYHDPCYLARYNGICEAPRELLRATATNVGELPRNKELTFCCGGGGGNSWYEVHEKERISVIRLKEAEQAGAQLLTVACPYCISMFEDAILIRGLEGKLKVKDISEMIAESIEQ